MARGRRRLSLCREKSSRKAPADPASGRRGLAAGALTIGSFAASLFTPAQALTLGEISLQSALGQPLSARIPVQMGPGEVLGAGCVSLPVPARSDLSALPRPDVTVPEATGSSSFELRITTTQPLYEPMYELQVQVSCAGTPLLLRQYVLMLDLPGTVQPGAAATATVPAEQQPAADGAPPAMPATDVVRSNSRPVRTRPQVTPGAPIGADTRYRVAAGDTLSTIAARVRDHLGQGQGQGKSKSIWQLAEQILAANPEAFIGGNPDLIKLGSEIVIPGPGAAAATDVVNPPSTAAAPAASEPAPQVIETTPPAAVPAPQAIETTPAAAVPAPQADSIGPVAAVAAPDAGTASTPVFEDEQPAVVPPAAAPAVAPAPDRSGAPPWLAALIGVLIGAAVSLALLRDRLLAAVNNLLAPHKPVIESLASAPAPQAPVTRPVPQFSQPLVAREPSMVVEEHPAEDLDEEEPLARTDESVTVEQPAVAKVVAAAHEAGDDQDLAHLFGMEPDLPLDADAGDGLPATADLDLDLSAAGGDTVDQDIGWIGDDTALTPTTQSMELSGQNDADTVEHIDLQTLSQRAGDDPAISQTLRDALNLLESDYEEDLTASRAIGRNKIERLLDAGDTDDTFVRTGTDLQPHRR